MTPAGTQPMSGLRIAFLAIVMVLLLMTLAAKAWLAALMTLIAMVLVLPWPFLFAANADGSRRTRGDKLGLRRWMGRAAVLLSMMAFYAIASAGSETPKGRAAMAKHDRERRIEAAMAQARDRAKAASEQAAAVEELRSGLHCLSHWDGAFPALVAVVEPSMRNPDSFEHIRTQITRLDSEGNHRVLMEFRAQNGFGGMNVGSASGLVRGSDCRLLAWRIMD